jgi:Zn-dependent peptidase ImmA (M78 family)/DNA-binding XRE family transcriptional regulator
VTATAIKLSHGPSRVSLGDKIRCARLATGMSTRLAAERISRRLNRAVSHTTLVNYEKDKYAPGIDVLAAMSSEFDRPINWFLDFGPQLTGVTYRNLKSKVTARDRHRYEALAQRWVEAYRRLEHRISEPLIDASDGFRANPGQSGESLARDLRLKLGLDFDDPVPSTIELMEWFGIRVMELRTDLAIDAMAAMYGDEHVVILNPMVSNDRCRLNAAHELAHVQFRDCKGQSELSAIEIENRAFEFASHLLLPSKQLKSAFEGQSVVRLVRFKERFGISLAAMLYRAEHTGILSKSQARQLWIEFARRGWRRREPGYVRPDRSTRFEQLLEKAMATEGMTLGQVARCLALREEEVRARIDSAIGAETDQLNDESSTDGVVIRFQN